jgi:serine/threonine protein kinase
MSNSSQNSNDSSGKSVDIMTPDELSDDATRVIAAKQPLRQDAGDGSTVIVNNPSNLSKPASVTETSAQFPITQPTKIFTQSAPSPIDTNLLPMGTRVAEFEITQLIGQGGFGVVYEAWDHALERVVAIKEYMPTTLANRQTDGSVVPISEKQKETFDVGMRSFINEARLLAQFDHPSLVKVYRFWQERGTTYMVMPYYKGVTLKQALTDGQTEVSERWLLEIIDGVSQALDVMHRANCYHRDIAPDNIMLLESTGLPVVLDFGAARRVITDVTQAITVILKPGYAPIEQYSEMPDMTQGAWTDVYALSAVMHVAITGRSPPPSVARLLNDRYVPLAADAVLLTRFTPKVLAAIDNGLGVRPESRPQSMAQFRLALGLPALGDAASLAQSSRTQQSKSPISDVSSVHSSEASQPFANDVALEQSKKLWILGGLVVIAIGMAGAGWWYKKSIATVPAPAVTQALGGSTPATSTAIVKPPDIPIPAPLPASPPQTFSLSRSLNDLLGSASAGREVTAKPVKSEVRIGKDKLEFQVQSNKAGFVYVYYLSSGNEMYLLYPNALDKRNRIEAGATLSLPRPSWAMEAGGPAGTDEFVVIVSDRERDLKATGIQYDGVFGQFPTKILAALEAGRTGGLPVLLGTPLCEGTAPCVDQYGAVSFKITEK